MQYALSIIQFSEADLLSLYDLQKYGDSYTDDVFITWYLFHTPSSNQTNILAKRRILKNVRNTEGFLSF